MKVFVAGATGAIGKRLVPRLVARGHEVVAMSHSRDKAESLRAAGAEPVVADGLDRVGVMQALMRSEPEAVIHEMTGLSGMTSVKNFDKEFALTNRLRSEGTDYLLEAAQAAGAQRFIVQSFGNWSYEAKRELEWTPGYPSWREGFRTGLVDAPAGARDAIGSRRQAG